MKDKHMRPAALATASLATASLATASLVPWDTLLTPGVMLQKDGSVLACFRYQGIDLYAAPESQLVVHAAQLNALFRALDGQWAVHADATRLVAQDYPATTWPDPVSRAVDDERRAFFTAHGQLYRTDTVLTLQKRRALAPAKQWQRLLYTNIRASDTTATLVRQFEEDISRVQAALAQTCLHVTRLEGSALLAYLHRTVSPKSHAVQVPTPTCYMDHYLTDADLTRHRRPASLLRWPRLGDHWIRCVSVKAYPAYTQPGMLDTLQSLALPYRATLRYLPMARGAALHALRVYRGAHLGQAGVDTALPQQAHLDWEAEARQAQAMVQHGEVTMGYLTQTVSVLDTDFDEATAKAEVVERALNNAGLVAKVETMNTMDAWVGSLPGNLVANVRKPLLHSHTLAHLMPSTTPWAGPTHNAHLHGPPLMQTVGHGQTPFALDTYDGDVGMVYVAGPSGSGKSTLLAMMALSWLKYPGAEVRIFDTGQSCKCLTYALGGQWYDIAAVLKAQSGTEGRLDDASTRPWGSPWLPPAHRWQCFELEGLLQTPGVLETVMRPLLHTLKARLTGAPTLFIFDEAHLYLQQRVLAEGIDDALRGFRKKNAAVIMATQSIADAARSALGPIISDTAMTRVLLANYHALEADTAAIYAGWGLNERERQIIAAMVPKQDYYLQAREGRRRFQLALGPLALGLVGTNRPPDLRLMDTLYQGDALAFTIAWLQAQGLQAQADHLARQGAL